MESRVSLAEARITEASKGAGNIYLSNERMQNIEARLN